MPLGPPENPGDYDMDWFFSEPDYTKLTQPGGVRDNNDLWEALRRNPNLRTLLDDNPHLTDTDVANSLDLHWSRSQDIDRHTRSRLQDLFQADRVEAGITDVLARMRTMLATSDRDPSRELANFDSEILDNVGTLLAYRTHEEPEIGKILAALDMMKTIGVPASAEVTERAKEVFKTMTVRQPDRLVEFIRVFAIDKEFVRQQVIGYLLHQQDCIVLLQNAGLLEKDLRTPDIQHAALEACEVMVFRQKPAAELLAFKTTYGLDDIAFGKKVQESMLERYWRHPDPPGYTTRLQELNITEDLTAQSVRAAALKSFTLMLKYGGAAPGILWLHDHFGFTDAELGTIAEETRKQVETFMVHGPIEMVPVCKTVLHMSDADMKTIAIELLRSRGSFGHQKECVENLLKAGVVTPDDIRGLQVEEVRTSLSNGRSMLLDEAKKLAGDTVLFGPEESLAMIGEQYREALRNGSLESMDRLAKICDVSLILAQPGIRDDAKEGIVSRFSCGIPQTKTAERIRDDFGITQDEYLECARKGACKLIEVHWLESAERVIELFGFVGLPTSPEGRAAALRGMAGKLKITSKDEYITSSEKKSKKIFPGDKSIADALECQRFSELTDEEAVPAIREVVLDALAEYDDESAQYLMLLKSRFPAAKAEFESEAAKEAAALRIIELLPEGKMAIVKQHRDLTAVDDERFKMIARKAMIDLLFAGNFHTATQMQTEFGMPENLDEYVPVCSRSQQSVIECWGHKDIQGLRKFCFNNPEYMKLTNNPRYTMALQASDVPALKVLHLSPLEGEQLRRHQKTHEGDVLTLQTIAETGNNDQLLNQLKIVNQEWKDTQNVTAPYLRAVECFGEGDPAAGHKRVRAFMSRPGLSRHDALVAMDPIIKLQGISGLKPKSFYGQILEQVRMSGEQHDGLTAHHHLNTVAQNLNPDIAGTLEKARSFNGVKRLQTMAQSFSDPRKVFESWGNLKRFYQLSRELERGEGLRRLSDLRAAGKDKLCDFAETLAFHETSDVSITDTMLFVEQPNEFLDSGDAHAPSELQQNKKPSNYTRIPHLGLTAEDLRDGLVEGTFDRMQRFRPLEIRYKIPRPGSQLPPAGRHERIRAAYAQLEKRGSGENRKVFPQLTKLLQPSGTDLKTYLAGQGETPDAALDAMEGVMAKYLPKLFAVESDELVVKVNLKSDPIGILAGNDTECCMKFGTANGKNNIYMYNPGDAVLTIQLQRKEGNRTIAQSLLTEDMDIGLPVPDVRGKLLAGMPLTEILPDAKLNDVAGYMSGDNVQVAPNYAQEPYLSLIRTVFADFTHEYLQRYGDADNLTKDKVPVGTMYSAAHGTGNAPNTFSPMVPLSYSDKTGPQVCVVTPEKLVDDRHKTVIEHAKPDNPTLKPISTSGVSHLVPKDTIPTAYLEERIYHDNATLVMHLHNIENGLIAVGANNIRKNKPHLCFKCRDKTGRMTGYMIAYEGVLSNQNAKVNISEELEGKPAVYIADMAGENRIAGAALTQEFIAQYTTEYLTKGVMMPIYAETRESTSYKTMLRRLQRSAPPGVVFALQELPTYQAGKDTMHPVFIVPSREDAPGTTQPVEHPVAA